MTLAQARNNQMPFGKHKGRKLKDIEEHDLLYLDWLIGQDYVKGWLREAATLICEARAQDIQSKIDERDD